MTLVILGTFWNFRSPVFFFTLQFCQSRATQSEKSSVSTDIVHSTSKQIVWRSTFSESTERYNSFKEFPALGTILYAWLSLDLPDFEVEFFEFLIKKSI